MQRKEVKVEEEFENSEGEYEEIEGSEGEYEEDSSESSEEEHEESEGNEDGIEENGGEPEEGTEDNGENSEETDDPETDDPEIWHSLSTIGFSKYEISTHGRVKNIRGRILSHWKNDDGYACIKITNDEGKSKHNRVHGLLGKLLLGCDGKIITPDHINRNRLDNNIKNLRPATRLKQLENRVIYKKRERRVTQTSKNGKTKIWASPIEAQKALKLPENSVGRACKSGKLLHDCLWEYTDDKDLDGEIWKSTKDVFPEWKEVLISNFGRIRRTWGLLKGYTSFGFPQSGYLSTKVCQESDDEYVPIYVHRLVCACFNGRNDLWVNHLDGDKKNNKIENLEYATPTENLNHAIAIGLLDPSTSKTCSIKVRQFTVNGIFVKEFNSMTAAAKEMKVSKQGISCACKGKIKTSAGHVWKAVQ
jgi:hypothetical protein